MSSAGAEPRELIAGLVAQMQLVSAVADLQGKDAGDPDVPQFGRDLYYLSLLTVIPRPAESIEGPEKSKYEVLGARWPTECNHGAMRRAHVEFRPVLNANGFGQSSSTTTARCAAPKQRTGKSHLRFTVTFTERFVWRALLLV